MDVDVQQKRTICRPERPPGRPQLAGRPTRSFLRRISEPPERSRQVPDRRANLYLLAKAIGADMTGRTLIVVPSSTRREP